MPKQRRGPNLPVQLIAFLDREIAANKTHDGTWDYSEHGTVHAALRQYLIANPLPAAIHAQATQLLTNWVDARRLEPTPGQGLLFEPEILLTLGEGKVVEWGEARPLQIRAHRSVLIEEHLTGLAAFTRKIALFDAHLALYRDENETTLAMQQREFAYRDPSK